MNKNSLRILIEITHPAHVHFFRNAIRILQERGHTIAVTARQKDVAIKLLENYRIPFTILSRIGHSKYALVSEMIARDIKLWNFCRKFKPDIMTGIAGTFAAPVGRLIRTPVIVFYDTENATISNAIAFLCAQAIVKPSCYKKPIKGNHITYQGYHELAYLHPNYFSPDPSILKILDVNEHEKFIIMRLVSWGAAHDVGHNGISPENIQNAVRQFSKYAKIFITSERILPYDLDKYRIAIPPEKMHDALYYATLFYGESATMASECAVCGTPAIYLDNVGRGYTDEQEAVYGSVFNFTESLQDQEKSIAKGIELLQTNNLKEMWKEKSKRILSDKIDVTAFTVDLIENYLEVTCNVRNSRNNTL